MLTIKVADCVCMQKNAIVDKYMDMIVIPETIESDIYTYYSDGSVVSFQKTAVAVLASVVVFLITAVAVLMRLC